LRSVGSDTANRDRVYTASLPRIRGKMSVKLTVTLEEGDKSALDVICLTLGYARGGRPNISQLFRSIASGGVVLTKKDQVLEVDDDGEF
jgi:hypothetical protein